MSGFNSNGSSNEMMLVVAAVCVSVVCCCCLSSAAVYVNYPTVNDDTYYEPAESGVVNSQPAKSWVCPKGYAWWSKVNGKQCYNSKTKKYSNAVTSDNHWATHDLPTK